MFTDRARYQTRNGPDAGSTPCTPPAPRTNPIPPSLASLVPRRGSCSRSISLEFQRDCCSGQGDPSGLKVNCYADERCRLGETTAIFIRRCALRTHRRIRGGVVGACMALGFTAAAAQLGSTAVTYVYPSGTSWSTTSTNPPTWQRVPSDPSNPNDQGARVWCPGDGIGSRKVVYHVTFSTWTQTPGLLLRFRLEAWGTQIGSQHQFLFNQGWTHARMTFSESGGVGPNGGWAWLQIRNRSD